MDTWDFLQKSVKSCAQNKAVTLKYERKKRLL